MHGFSNFNIAKNNPKTKTTRFGSMKGQAIRQRYMAMTYGTIRKDATVKTPFLLAGIAVRTRSSFSRPDNLYVPSLVTPLASILVSVPIADTMRIAPLVDVIFCRGITMQRAIAPNMPHVP